jgi:ABC-type polysaccharide/polyol phosphate export permease
MFHPDFCNLVRHSAGLVNFFIGLIPLAIVVFISAVKRLAWTLPLVIVVAMCIALFDRWSWPVFINHVHPL